MMEDERKLNYILLVCLCQSQHSHALWSCHEAQRDQQCNVHIAKPSRRFCQKWGWVTLAMITFAVYTHTCVAASDGLESVEAPCTLDRKGEGLTCKGQRPARTRKRLDLPLPLGPMIMMDVPGGTSKVRSRTSGVPSGLFKATLLPATSHQHSVHKSWQPCAML